MFKDHGALGKCLGNEPGCSARAEGVRNGPSVFGKVPGLLVRTQGKSVKLRGVA